MFKPQFATLIESGAKCQTVRPTPKRMPKPGDRISLRVWTGKPYRSKQRILGESTISQVQNIRLDCKMFPSVVVKNSIGDTRLMSQSEAEAFARADGFENFQAMADWFKSTHGLPFEGIVIKWIL